MHTVYAQSLVYKVVKICLIARIALINFKSITETIAWSRWIFHIKAEWRVFFLDFSMKCDILFTCIICLNIPRVSIFTFHIQF